MVDNIRNYLMITMIILWIKITAGYLFSNTFFYYRRENADSRFGKVLPRLIFREASSSDIEKVLREQGLDLQDLYSLRNTLVNSSSNVVAGKVSNKRSLPKYSDVEKNSVAAPTPKKLFSEKRKDNSQKKIIISPEQSRPVAAPDIRNTMITTIREPLRTEIEQDKMETSKSVKSNHVDLTGVTLENILTYLVNNIGYDGLYDHTKLRCFNSSPPSFKGALKLLRQADMEWARKKLEYVYVQERKREAAG